MVVIPWFVLELTGSYAQMGIVGFFTVLPRVIATFFGGQFVDRLGFRRFSILGDVLSGISVSAIPVLYALDHLSFPALLAMVVVGAVFDGPATTAKEAMIPELAANAEFDLDRVNSWFVGARRLAGFVGPVVAGFLITLVGTVNVLWVNAAVFAVSAILTWLLVIDAVPVDLPSTADGFWANTVYGFKFLREHSLLLWLAVLVCIMNFIEAPLAIVVLPALVNEEYGGPEQLGLLLGFLGAGAVVGTLGYATVAARWSRLATFVASFTLVGVTLMGLAFTPMFAVALVLMLIMGFVGGPLNPILMSVRQERVPVEVRAKVFGTFTSIGFVAIPLGQLLGGYLIEWVGVTTYILGVALIYIGISFSFAFIPTLRQMNASKILSTHSATGE
jgi:MFS family permease